MSMNKLNQKGITIISLIITIIVMLILASITIYTGNNVIKQAKLQTINTNMMLIQVKVKTIAEQAKFNKDTSNYSGNVLTNVSNNKKIEELVNNGLIDDKGKYYLLSSGDLYNMGLQKIDIEDGYVVNYDTEEVIYVKGFEYDKTTYYKLSDMKKLTID